MGTFENRVRVGATETKRVDAGSSNTSGPSLWLGDDLICIA